LIPVNFTVVSKKLSGFDFDPLRRSGRHGSNQHDACEDIFPDKFLQFFRSYSARLIAARPHSLKRSNWRRQPLINLRVATFMEE
jgi:hypothetical protein